MLLLVSPWLRVGDKEEVDFGQHYLLFLHWQVHLRGW
jgi:hypothetical protein